jgi:hypothetical protein
MRTFLECVRHITLVLTILAGTSHTIIAATQVFQEHNFALDIPSNWHALNPPPKVLAAVQSPDRSRTILIFAGKLPAGDIRTALHEMSRGAMQSVIEKGWQVTSEHMTSINGIPFNVFLTRVSSNSTAITYLCVAGNEAYWMSGSHNSGNADADGEIISSIESFRLLTPRSLPPPSLPVSDAYRKGYAFGRVLMLVFLGGVILWVIQRLIGKKRQKSG